jgi:hypothetical protein
MGPLIGVPSLRTVPSGMFEIVIAVLFSVERIEAKFNTEVSKRI